MPAFFPGEASLEGLPPYTMYVLGIKMLRGEWEEEKCGAFTWCYSHLVEVFILALIRIGSWDLLSSIYIETHFFFFFPGTLFQNVLSYEGNNPASTYVSLIERGAVQISAGGNDLEVKNLKHGWRQCENTGTD